MSKEDLEQADAPNTAEEVQEEVVAEEEVAEETLEDSLGTSDTPKEEPKKESKSKDSVSLKKYLAEKKKRQEAEKQLSELQEADDEDDDDSEDLDVDQPSNDVTDRLAKLEADKKRVELDSKYDALYTTTIDNHPEFKDIADKEVIKQLAFNPANKNKTLPQILEQTYGRTLQGRPSIETDVQPTNPTPGNVDVDKAKKDSDYFKKVMADPKLKAEYNKSLEERIML